MNLQAVFPTVVLAGSALSAPKERIELLGRPRERIEWLQCVGRIAVVGFYMLMSRASPVAAVAQREDGLLTAEEVATILQVTPAWVYAETRRRRIPHVRLGRYVRYRRVALMAWLDEGERSSVSATQASPTRTGSASTRRLRVS
jgi:excisionase family DNA binding protein